MDYIALAEKHGGLRAAARAAGISYSTFQARHQKQRENLDLKSITQATKYGIKLQPDAPIKFVYFTDAHNAPNLPLDRFYWLAALVNEVAPQYLIDGGDFDDLGSLCRHEGNETWKGKFKASFLDDIEASMAARKILHDNIKAVVCKHVTLGNHEHRLWEYENSNPEVYGMMQHAYLEILRQFGWNVTMYRDYLTLHGIDFTHIPQSTMNKPVGGQNPCNIISRDSIRDVVFGHTHGLGLQVNHKLGPCRSVVAFNAGCYMPAGYVPAYSKGSRKEFWYGAHVLESINGRLHVARSITMSEMERIYR